MTLETLAEEIAWLSNEDLDKLVDILTKAYPTRANQMEQSIVDWKIKVIPKPSSKPADKSTSVESWWKSKF